MPRRDSLQRKSLASQVADALRELIFSNEYPQGYQLRQDEVSKRLGVSHIPVREAFQLLEAEGLITTVPYRGAVVSTLSATEILEYFDIRAVLEVDLLRRAIPTITADVIERARQIVTQMDGAAPLHWGELNWELHEALYAPANRPITLELVRKIHDNLDRYVRIQLTLSSANKERAHREHEALIELCAAGEKAKAARLLIEHINGVRDDLLDHLSKHPQP
jgi:DNA-binding GntR family transcriptional regulator